MPSVWRTALERQETLVRVMRGPQSRDIMAAYYNESKQLQAQIPNPAERAKWAITVAGKIIIGMATRIAEAEPIWVDKEILVRLIEQMGAERLEDTEEAEAYFNNYRHMRLGYADFPIKNGLVLPEQLIAPPDIDANLRTMGVTDIPRQGFQGLQFCAFHYGPAHQYEFGAGKIEIYSHPKNTTGVIAFGCLGQARDARDILPFVVDALDPNETFMQRMERLMALHYNRTDWTIQVHPIKFLYHLSRFMREQIVELETTRAEGRKQYKLAARMNTKGIIQVVRWRRVEKPRDPDHRTEHRDWSCHWTVKSHTRYYKKSGKTVTVRSYVKGDLTKPLKRTNTTINLVDR